MFILVVVGLVAVIALASRAPAPSDSNGTVPPNQLLPPTGGSPIQSPATTGPNGLSSSWGKVIAQANAALPRVVPGTRQSWQIPPAASTDTSGQDKMLTTQTPTPTTKTLPFLPSLSNTVRKL